VGEEEGEGGEEEGRDPTEEEEAIKKMGKKAQKEDQT